MKCVLVVELDGAVHDTPAQRQYDAMRTTVLESYGYRVLRIDASLVERDVLVAVAVVREAVHQRW